MNNQEFKEIAEMQIEELKVFLGDCASRTRITIPKSMRKEMAENLIFLSYVPNIVQNAIYLGEWIERDIYQ